MQHKVTILFFLVLLYTGAGSGNIAMSAQESPDLDKIITACQELNLLDDREGLDSLAEVLILKAEYHNAEYYLNYGYYFKCIALTHRLPSQAIEYGQMSLAYFEKEGHHEIKTQIIFDLAKAYRIIAEYDTSVAHYEHAIALVDEHDLNKLEKFRKQIPRAYYSMGFAMLSKGDLSRGAKYTTYAQENVGSDTILQIAVLNQFGNLEILRKNYAEAEKYYLEYQELALQFQPSIVVYAYEGLGSIYEKRGQLDSARIYFEKALMIHVEKDENLADICIALYNLAQNREKEKDFENAQKYAHHLLDRANEHSMAKDRLNAYEVLARINLSADNIAEAEHYVKLALESRELNTEYDFLSNIYLTAAQIAQRRSKYEEAYSFHLLHKQYSDSLINAETTNEINQIKYEHLEEVKEKEVSDLQNELLINRFRSNQRITFVSLLALLSLLSILGLIIYSRQRRRNLMAQKEEIENKLLRSQMNPHFIFNAISSIQNFFYDESDMKTGLNYMSQLAKLMRQILENSREEYITLAEELDSLNNYLDLQHLRYANAFGFDIIVDDDIDPCAVLVPPLIIQPLVENAIEHGMIYRIPNGKVQIIIENKSDHLGLQVRDNGKGVNATLLNKVSAIKDNKSSISTLISKERLKLLSNLHKKQFELIISNISSGGTLVSLQLPKVSAL